MELEVLIQQAIDLQVRGQIDAAIELYAKIYEAGLLPPAAKNNFAVALQQKGKLKLAADLLHPVSVEYPGFIDVWINLASVYFDAKRFKEAIEYADKALAIDAQNRSALLNKALCYVELGEFESASALYAYILDKSPEDIDTLNNQANLLRRMGLYEAAYEAFKSLYVLDNSDRTTLNFALSCADVGESETAIRLFKALNGNPEAELNLALHYLVEEQWPQANAFYGARFRAPGVAGVHPWRRPNMPNINEWQGQTLNESDHLLCWGEQGIGDEVMFASCLSTIHKRLARLTLECNPRLASLMARSFPDCEVIARADVPVNDGSRFSHQISTGSALVALLNHDSGWRNPAPFFKADNVLSQTLRRQYFQHFNAKPGDRLIGISWASRNPQVGRRKSMALAELVSLWDLPDCHFVSVQYGDTAAERHEFEQTGKHLYEDASIDPMGDLDPVAAQIAALDAVVSVSNATLHLAGALGVPSIALLAKGSDWRWGRERTDCLWYPSLQICRQEKAGEWESVIAAARNILAKTGG